MYQTPPPIRISTVGMATALQRKPAPSVPLIVVFAIKTNQGQQHRGEKNSPHFLSNRQSADLSHKSTI